MKLSQRPAFWILSFGFHALAIVIAALASIVIEMPEDDERGFVPMVSGSEVHAVALLFEDDGIGGIELIDKAYLKNLMESDPSEYERIEKALEKGEYKFKPGGCGCDIGCMCNDVFHLHDHRCTCILPDRQSVSKKNSEDSDEGLPPLKAPVKAPDQRVE